MESTWPPGCEPTSWSTARQRASHDTTGAGLSRGPSRCRRTSTRIGSSRLATRRTRCWTRRPS
eukprot:5662650-Lingulodinium_polyedra.AAC.1